MKHLKQYIITAIIAASLAVLPRSSWASPAPQQAQVSIAGFYNALSPYGTWMNYGSYGQVWVPNVGQDFQPYATAGHWVYTDYGWTWVSDYDWGWAPFHYGRWLYDNSYGWIWVPGTEWAPAWVSWRNSPDYYGWAPLGPGMSIGVSVNIAPAYWSFVPCRYITSPYVHRYYVDRGRNVNIIHNTTIINNTTVINNRTYYRGPATRDVERVTRTRVRPMRIADSDRPGATTVSRNRVSIYRPQPAALRQPSPAPAPSRVLSNGNRDNDRRNNFDRPADPNRNVPTAPNRVRNNDNNNINRPAPAPVNNNNNPVNNNTNNGVPRRVNDNLNRNNPGNPARPESQPRTLPAPTRPTPTPKPTTPSAPAARPAQPQREISRPQPTPQPQRIQQHMPQPQREAPRPQPVQQPRPQMQQPRPQPTPRPRVQPQPQRQSAPAAPQRTTRGRNDR